MRTVMTRRPIHLSDEPAVDFYGRTMAIRFPNAVYCITPNQSGDRATIQWTDIGPDQIKEHGEITISVPKKGGRI